MRPTLNKSRRAMAVLASLSLFTPLLVNHQPASAAAAYSQTWQVTLGTKAHFSSPTAADLNGDGVDEIIVGSLDGYLRVYQANGSLLWQAMVDPLPGHPTAVESTPTVADLYNDGRKEIIVGAGSLEPSGVNQQGGVVAFDAQGGTLWRYRTGDAFNQWTGGPPDGYSDGVFSTPAVGDVDGDGFPDIVFGSWDHYVHVLNRYGQATPSLQYDSLDTVWSSPALYDVNGDGRLDIIIGGDATPDPTQNRPGGGLLRVLTVSGSTLVPLWTQRTTEIVAGSPTIADINGDGRLEVVVSTGNYWHTADSRHIFAWHLDDGSLAPGWPVTTNAEYNTFTSPAVGDVNGDGKPDVVMGDNSGTVYAWGGNGALLWAHPNVFGTNSSSGIVVGQPIIADVNGDGQQDVVFGNQFGTYMLNGANGAAIAGNLTSFTQFFNSSAVVHAGSLGTQLVVVGLKNSSQFQMTSFALPASSAAAADPMFHVGPTHVAAPKSGGDPVPFGLCSRPSNPAKNPSASSARGYWLAGRDGGVFSFPSTRPFYGSLPGLGISENTISIAASPSGNGYWLVGSSGRVFAFGDAPSYGDMSATHLNAPVIRLEPTVTGLGYWLLASDGGVFSFGDARFYGSTGGMHLNAPVVSMAATPSGQGYWLVAKDGGVFTFGDARFLGSTGNIRLNAPVVSMTPDPKGNGYWLLGGDGGVFSFNVPFYGSVPGSGACTMPVGVQIRASATGAGYWVVASDGNVYEFGDAAFLGSYPGLPASRGAVDMAIVK